jgi:hypothetical protein
MSMRPLSRWIVLLTGIGLVALAPYAASAQTEGAQVRTESASADVEHGHERNAGVFGFLGGAALGLATHESGHLTMDLALGATPHVKAVDFHGIPFFAISPQRAASDRERYAIASAGFWVQHGVSEWVLTRTPDLRFRRAPVAKGLLAFHVGCSLAYAGAALARTGPAERDTRGMAESQHVNERWIAAAVLTPAALDTYRYYHPRQRWAAWASRAAKLSLVLLVLR